MPRIQTQPVRPAYAGGVLGWFRNTFWSGGKKRKVATGAGVTAAAAFAGWFAFADVVRDYIKSEPQDPNSPAALVSDATSEIEELQQKLGKEARIPPMIRAELDFEFNGLLRAMKSILDKRKQAQKLFQSESAKDVMAARNNLVEIIRQVEEVETKFLPRIYALTEVEILHGGSSGFLGYGAKPAQKHTTRVDHATGRPNQDIPVEVRLSKRTYDDIAGIFQRVKRRAIDQKLVLDTKSTLPLEAE